MTFEQILSEIRITGLRALPWKQPYANLMLHGKIETRVWPTMHRGWVLICASKKPYELYQVHHISGMSQYVRMMDYPTWLPDQLGHAIALGKLVDSRPMTKEDEDACFVKYDEPWVEFESRKDGTAKRVDMRLWCHVYEHVTPIEPFPYPNGQKWTIPTEEHIKLLKPTLPPS